MNLQQESLLLIHLVLFYGIVTKAPTSDADLR